MVSDLYCRDGQYIR